MMKIGMFLMFIVAIELSVLSQNIELLYLDDRTNDNLVSGIIEDDDGNYVYVGSCAADGIEYYGNALISKITPDGNCLNRYVEYCEDITITAPTNQLRYQNLFLTSRGTYFVVGSRILEGDGYVIVREFDKNLNLIMGNETKISEGEGTEINTITKVYGNDEYILSFYYTQISNNGWYGVTCICKLNRDNGSLSNIQEVIRLDPSSGNNFICNIVPINGGEKFMLLHLWGYLVYDSDINLLEIINFGYDTEFVGHLDDGVCFNNGQIIYFGRERYDRAYSWSLDIREVRIDNLKSPKRLYRFGEKKTHDYNAVVYNSRMKGCDYVTDDNLVFGGTFNSIPERNYIQIHSLYPSILGVGSYNRIEDKINWECYYEDGEHCFYMTSICATRDGGAIVTATRASGDQALNYLSDIAIFKVSGVLSVDKLPEERMTFSVYPNPVSDKLTIICEEAEFNRLYFYDVTGRLCKSVIIDASVSKLEIDVNDLNLGIYQLQIVDIKGNTSACKIIVK